MPALALQIASKVPSDKTEAELAAALFQNAVDLLAQDVEAAGRQKARHQRKVIANRGGVGEQAIDRNKRGDGGKEGKEAVEDDPSGDGKQAVIAERLEHPLGDLLPIPPGGIGKVARLFRFRARYLLAPGLRRLLAARISSNTPGSDRKPCEHQGPFRNVTAGGFWHGRVGISGCANVFNLAHDQIGEPGSSPDQVQDRLSPDHAQGITAFPRQSCAAAMRGGPKLFPAPPFWSKQPPRAGRSRRGPKAGKRA